MSIASTAYDNLLSRLATLFPAVDGYKRLNNPYEPEQNPSIILAQGYGLAVGPGVQSNRQLSSIVTTSRTFSVVLTRAADATEHDDTRQDDRAKELLEDAREVVNSFEREVRLENLDLNVKYESDGGIESITPDDRSILVMKLQFVVDYFDAP